MQKATEMASFYYSSDSTYDKAVMLTDRKVHSDTALNVTDINLVGCFDICMQYLSSFLLF